MVYKVTQEISAMTFVFYLFQGNCHWVCAGGRRVELRITSLTKLCDGERQALQQIALQRLFELDLGCNISVPKGKMKT